jgi:tRNA(Arg) A34 adenosine deaminase TadA
MDFMRRAIMLSEAAIRSNQGGPFGAVIVKDGVLLAEGYNRVMAANDPTAHAEIEVIRAACKALGRFHLEGCVLYTSCEPCPMCLGAIYWARLAHVYYANTRDDAAQVGFDDAWLYHEILLSTAARAIPATRLLVDEARVAFTQWQQKADKVTY